MLRLTCHQFRCWEKLRLEFPLGKITLLRGNSGAGKTTILQALAWCLYGNIRLVAPTHLDKAKTRVVLELPGDVIIDRQKNPNRLLLTHGGKIYEDKVAQSLIDELFGNYDIWLASCYIGQGCRNSFLTAPNTGKMELLNSITFHDEDPTSYIEKIDQMLTETDVDYKSKLSAFNTNVSSLQALLSRIDVTKALTRTQVNKLKEEIEILNRQASQLQNIKKARDITLGMQNNLSKQLDALSYRTVTSLVISPELKRLEQYGWLPEFISSEEVEKKITLISEEIPKLQQRDKLAGDIASLNNQLLPFVHYQTTTTYSNADYEATVAQEVLYRENQRVVQSMNVLYSITAIAETIDGYRKLLASQERIKLTLDKNSLEQQMKALEAEQLSNLAPLQFPDLTSVPIAAPDYTKYDTSKLQEQIVDLSKQQGELQAHIQVLHKGRDVLSCPKCQVSLRYQQGTIVAADAAPVSMVVINSKEQELQIINAQISKFTKDIQQLTQTAQYERVAYDQKVIAEQRRIDTLKEKIKQSELEKQRREIAAQTAAVKLQELRSRLEEISSKLLTLPETTYTKLLNNTEIETIYSNIGKLSNLTVIPLPQPSSQQIQSYLRFQELTAKLSKATAESKDYIEKLPEHLRSEKVGALQQYIVLIRNHWNRIRDSAEETIQLQRMKTALQEQLAVLILEIDPTTDIQQCEIAMKDRNLAIELDGSAQVAIEQHSKVTKEREELLFANTQLGDLQTLRQFAVEAECKILQDVVDSINTSMDGICTTLFDKEIVIALNLFKMSKTTKSVKPTVNFSVAYQGGTFDNINQMSGGEGDRASLALTLALNRLSGCPILLLDESLSALDLNMKESAIKAIREHTDNTVLLIMHDGIEGVFDHVINIDDFREDRY